jgi:hypothetical protein
MSEQNGKPSGGIGGELFANDRHILSDLNISRRAIRNGWNVKPELKQRILDRMALIIEVESDDDIAIKASKIVLEADKIDLMTERNGKPEEQPKVTVNVAVNNVTVEGVLDEYSRSISPRAVQAQSAQDNGTGKPIHPPEANGKAS